MKFFTLLTLSGISICAAPVLNAQESKSPWSFGAKVGVNLSTFAIDKINYNGNTDGVTGFNGGLTVEYALRNGFFLNSGLEFTTKGADFIYSGAYLMGNEDQRFFVNGYSKETKRLKFLQLPLTIGYRIPVSKSVNITFDAGAYFAFGISGKGTLETSSVIQDLNSEAISYDYSKVENSKNGDTDYGLLGGIGLEYKKFSIKANYEFGLRELYTASPSLVVSGDWKNRNATLSVGYKF